MSNGADLPGLTSAEAAELLAKHGKNELSPAKKESLLKKVWHVLCEPMFLLLIIAAVIYFILGEPRDALVMIVFVIVIICIDVIQEWKTDKTLNALKDLSAPRISVIRDGAETQIASAELVPGDIMLIREGVKIPADGSVVKCSDLRVDESSLTGEPEGVWKTPGGGCYAGTLVTQGYAAVRVEKTGASTEYGKIGAHVADAPREKTPLQKQVSKLVKTCVGIAAALCVLAAAATWFNGVGTDTNSRIIAAVLSGVTLSMALIPEEFPVILTVFLSMGAWRIAKKQSLVRKLPSVETLGAVSALCVDKTGTITINQMTVQDVWPFDGGDAESLVETMGLACETDAYDPMEKAMLSHCEKVGVYKSHIFGGELIKEYAFTNELKMMGHVWRHDGQIIIAAKGSPENILDICELNYGVRMSVEERIRDMSGHGLRVIAVASSVLGGEPEIPAEITDCKLTLCGLIGLADPPRASVKGDLAICRKAGVRVVMITGDNGITAASIADQIGMDRSGGVITGIELDEMSDAVLCQKVKTVNIFSRVTPGHKMRIVKAFKDNGEIVAMTGDGVNDAPALKYADIGIAMGKRGSEVSREAADLILMDDNFSTIVDTVKDGRRIYDNIRKAVGYVFVIHIPLAVASLLAPALGVTHESLLLLPLHVALLELVIDPTCSIVLERQPAEENIMERGPRDPKKSLLDARTLAKSVIQGLAIAAAAFGAYYYTLMQDGNAPLARSMGIAVIMLANLFLVQVNSSDTSGVFTSVKRLSKDKVMWAVNILTLIGLFVILYTPLNGFLKLAPLTPRAALTVLGLSAASVLWYEIVKVVRRKKH